ncbi:hypothetical protein [Halobellus inordinatus]|uniref:DUF7847 domain-containing protein n=1 Tax=Halobellus inordinatus TaxID=1126236 RepID=UPI002109D81B|nr:hypothetical protein [Halobellus inordinatus]
MAVLTALRQSPGALLRNPVLFVPILALMIVQFPILLLQSVNPLLASVASAALSLVFVAAMPFVQGGLFAMADEALGGRTALDTFVAAGKQYYVAILIAYLVLVAVNFVFGMFGFAASIAGGVLFLGSGGFQSANLAALAVIGVVVAVALLAYLLIVFFVQFYGQAIVLEDRDAVDGLKRSVGVVRGNLLSTFGYTVLAGVVGGLLGSVFAVSSYFLTPSTTPGSTMGPGMAAAAPQTSASIAGLAGVTALIVVLGTLFGGFFTVFSVSFYREITG